MLLIEFWYLLKDDVNLNKGITQAVGVLCVMQRTLYNNKLPAKLQIQIFDIIMSSILLYRDMKAGHSQ